MSQGFTGEIRMFAGTYAPLHWTLCHGQLLAISDNSTLFSLIGTAYGGDGRTNFGIPDLRGRIPLHQGQGPGLSSRVVGQRFGSETVTLTTAQIPSHTHYLQASKNAATSSSPVNNVLADVSADGGELYKTFNAGDTPVEMATNQVSSTGSNSAHENVMPIQAINFIMCLQGLYPTRN